MIPSRLPSIESCWLAVPFSGTGLKEKVAWFSDLKKHLRKNGPPIVRVDVVYRPVSVSRLDLSLAEEACLPELPDNPNCAGSELGIRC